MNALQKEIYRDQARDFKRHMYDAQKIGKQVAAENTVTPPLFKQRVWACLTDPLAIPYKKWPGLFGLYCQYVGAGGFVPPEEWARFYFQDCTEGQDKCELKQQ